MSHDELKKIGDVWSVELACSECDFSITVTGELLKLRRFFASNGVPICPMCGFKLAQGPGKKINGYAPAGSRAAINPQERGSATAVRVHEKAGADKIKEVEK